MRHVPLRLHVVGKVPDFVGLSLQDADLQASIMIEMHMHAGDRDVMMIVMGVGELPGKVADAVIVGIAQHTDTGVQYSFLGKIRKTVIGHYRYLKDGETLLLVAVHLLKANVEPNTFPEQGERSRMWVAPSAAAAMVDEPELKEMLTKIDCRTVLASQERLPTQASKSEDTQPVGGTLAAGGLLSA